MMATRLPTTRRDSDVRTVGDTNFVLLVSPLPDSASAFCYCNQFICNSVRQLCIAALFRRTDNPLDCSAAALAQVQRMGDLHGSTTTSDTLLLANTKERSHRVDDEGEVKDRVKRQLRCRRSAEQRAAGVQVGSG